MSTKQTAWTGSGGNDRQLELCAPDFHLAEVRPLQLDVVSRGGRLTRGTSVRKLQGVGNSTFVLSVEKDNDFRSRCE
jgi:hypothetical protein